MMQFGNYPAAYDPAKHGVYDPSRYYGKPDTAFLDVKLKELPAWFGRREKTPSAIAELISRARWRWQMKYIHPRKAGVAAFIQVVVACGMFSYYLGYTRIKTERHYKYH